MLHLLRRWGAEQQRSAVVTLHDPALALNFCDQLLLLGDAGVLGILEPRKASLEEMEQLLRQVYGSISLQRCRNRQGEAQIVILREGEE